MKRPRWALRWTLVAVLGAGCGSSAERNDQGAGDAPSGATDLAILPTDAEVASWNGLVAFAKQALGAANTPGASVAVVLHGQLMFAQGLGRKSVDGSDPVTTDTRFRAASMSKMLLAATALTLVDEGKLDVQRPLTDYLPWFTVRNGFDPHAVQLTHLLSHSAGFPADTLIACVPDTQGPRLDWFTAHPQPLWAPPGEVYVYSNFGFALASVAITQAAGRMDADFTTLVHDRVFVPAHMARATYDVGAVAGDDYATGHDLRSDGTVVATYDPSQWACPLLDPPGGVWATASDYAHFMEVLMSSSLLSAQSTQLMMAPHAATHEFDSQAYGYGLLTQNYPYKSHPLVWHNGSLPGYLSAFYMVPDQKVGVVVLVNAKGATSLPDNIAVDGLRRFIIDKQVWPTDTSTPAGWGDYAGSYQDPTGELDAVTLSLDLPDGGAPTLHIEAPNARTLNGTVAPISGSMAHSFEDSWSMPDGTGTTFFRNDGGVVDRLVSRRGIAAKK